jgi:hypothetical protein
MNDRAVSDESSSLVYKGLPPIHTCCDATWRRLPNGEQGVFFMTGGSHEPEPGNHVVMCRSSDEGVTWGQPEIVQQTVECEHELTLPPHYLDPAWRERLKPGIADTMSEVVVHDGVITVYVQNHDGWFGHWKLRTVSSTDNGKTWSEPVPFEPMPRRAFIRNLYRTSWGEYLLPYQYYPVTKELESSPMGDGSMASPETGVFVGPTPSGPWTKGAPVKSPRGWAENNVVELRDGRLVMLSRSDEGVLFRTESTDRGRRWSGYRRTEIPNPSSKYRLFRLSDGRILLLHNPAGRESRQTINKSDLSRNPLSIWISGDDMQSWRIKKDVVTFPGALEYPDGGVSEDECFLHFAFDYNRHDVIYWKAAIPSA